MLFGTICAYTALGLFLSSLRSLMVAIGFTIFMYIYVKLFEEKRLLNDFGDEYVQYRKSTPMIFPYNIIEGLSISRKKNHKKQVF